MGDDADPDLVNQDDGNPAAVVVVSTNHDSGKNRRYHNDGCLRARRIDESTRMTREKAQEQGFIPCKDCHSSVDGGVYLSEGVADLIEQVRMQFDDN